MAEYHFTETACGDEIRLEWRKGDSTFDPLDFWIIEKVEVERAKERVRSGEFDDGE